MQTNRHHHHQSLLFTVAWVATIALLLMMLMLSTVLGLSAPKFPNRKVALITGSNKGIGYEIARKILSHKPVENEDGDNDEGAFVCLMGCRNRALGKAAAESLLEEARKTGNPGASVGFVEIDLADPDTIAEAVKHIETKYGRCDVLINNAAVCYNDPTLYGAVPHTPFAKQAEITIATNFFGTLALTRAMLPLLLKSGSTPRIVNIASSAGRLSIIPSEEKIAALSSESLSLEDLEAHMKSFVETARDGRHTSEGWPNTGYGVSKVGIIAMTKIFARQYGGGEAADTTILVNSVDPGYCATDQNNNQGVIPAERGAVTPYLLATLDEESGGYTGKHWYQEQEIAW